MAKIHLFILHLNLTLKKKKKNIHPKIQSFEIFSALTPSSQLAKTSLKITSHSPVNENNLRYCILK